MTPAPPESVEKFLSSNPNFVKDWFLKNVGHAGLQEWVDDEAASSNASSYHSAARNSLTANMFQDMIHGKRKSQPSKFSKTRDELTQMSETDIFMELIKDIANELDVNILCHKILMNVSLLTNSDRGSLFLTRGSGPNKFLVSKLFDVTENSSLEDSLHNEETEIRVPFGKGIAGTVAETSKPINIPDAYNDERFNKDVDKRTGYRTKSILCMPILNFEGSVVGVAQIMNKTTAEDAFFDEQDERVFSRYLTFCGIGLTNAQLFEMSVQEFKRNQLVLKLARGIFEEQSELDKLVQKIMLDAQDVLKCERSGVYLIEQAEEVSDSSVPQKTADDIVFSNGFELHSDMHSQIINLGLNDLEKASIVNIAKDVAARQEVLVVPDIITHPRFGKEVVNNDGFKVKNFLSFPIYDSNHKIIGIVQLMNKLGGRSFNSNDLNIVEAFAIFCGLGIYNCQMYEKACVLMAKQKVALEVLSYHATAPPEEMEKLKNAVIMEGSEIGLYSYDFNDFNLTDHETCRATIRMFLDTEVISEYHVPYDVLCRWVLSVKKNYRPVTYHNWRHAFNVAQTMFTMYFTGNMKRILSQLEIFALLVACLCHDLDHRGTNNAFQNKTESAVAQLYSTSTMEHHHFDQCIMILNGEGNNIFQHLTPELYKQAISVVENAILSTDLALYFKKKGNFKFLVESGESHWTANEKKELLRGMMMTACDVAAITKPWEIQQEVAHLVAGEFFEQGDLEREQLNEDPIAMMDRRKKDDLPKMQVGFIDAICLPLYEMLAKVDAGLEPLFIGVKNNRANWQALADQSELNKTGNEGGNKTAPSQPQTTKVNQHASTNSKSDGPNGEMGRNTRPKSKTCVLL